MYKILIVIAIEKDIEDIKENIIEKKKSYNKCFNKILIV